jgi:hypothetical protein
MPRSLKVFSSASAASRHSSLCRILASPTFSAACLLFSLDGFLVAAVSLPSACP